MSGKAVFSSDTARHRKKFIRYCMRLWSSTLLNMASQNLSSVTTVDLTALQRQQLRQQNIFARSKVHVTAAISSGGAAHPNARWI